MAYSIDCGDVMPGCAARFEAPTEEALLGEVAGHAAAEHGVTEITPEVLGAVKAAVRHD